MKHITPDFRPRAFPMTTVAHLVARKQTLLDRLQNDPGPHERDDIERLLAQIEVALDLLDRSSQIGDER